jgi:transcriptional regulator with XRE-family HTH domain
MVDPATFSQRDRARRPRPLLRTTLGEVLRRTRRGQGRTLADVARAARVSMPYLSELERGRKEASSEILAAICDALGIELADLLAEIGRDLVGRRDRRPAIIRLDSAREGLAQSPLPGSGDALHRQDRALRGSGDVVCLLAA